MGIVRTTARKQQESIKYRIDIPFFHVFIKPKPFRCYSRCSFILAVGTAGGGMSAAVGGRGLSRVVVLRDFSVFLPRFFADLFSGSNKSTLFVNSICNTKKGHGKHPTTGAPDGRARRLRCALGGREGWRLYFSVFPSGFNKISLSFYLNH